AAPQTSAPAPAPARAATPPKTPERAAPVTTASTNAAATPAPAAPRTASPQSEAVAATPRGAGGAYAVQLAAPGSEAEAKATISRLQQRYGAALAGRQPTVRRATVGDKSVYRVRVVGLSQSDAAGLCDRLKSAGGSCFVARE
ncbi:MAG: SPOR domain-containing protein, partial [Beijerinckiaceae bacterium]